MTNGGIACDGTTEGLCHGLVDGANSRGIIPYYLVSRKSPTGPRQPRRILDQSSAGDCSTGPCTLVLLGLTIVVAAIVLERVHLVHPAVEVVSEVAPVVQMAMLLVRHLGRESELKVKYDFVKSSGRFQFAGDQPLRGLRGLAREAAGMPRVSRVEGETNVWARYRAMRVFIVGSERGLSQTRRRS